MRAVIIDEPCTMRVGEWREQKPGANEALVEVSAAGICAGDMYFYLGKNPYAKYPQICGHEVAGTVVDVGEGLMDFRVGDRVVIEPFVSCGRCYPCRIGKSNCCANLEIIGVHRAGGYADYVLAPMNRLHRIPEGLSLMRASFAEPVAIGVQACRRGAVTSGDFVLVLGCGPIGLSVIEVARAAGARVVATDLQEKRTEAAKTLGAEVITAGSFLAEAIHKMTDGDGAHVVVEATGATQAIEQAVDLVAPGGRIVVLGLVTRGAKVQLPGLDLTRKEMTIVGSRASVNCFPESLRLLQDGKIRYPSLATEFDMWEAPGVFAQLAAMPDAVHKGVLVRQNH
jgi:L-gulonate 5-dehydrogenase